MSPFKTYYVREIEMWLRNHADRGVVTVYQIGKLFGNAYKKAETAEIAAKGFEKAGLFPCNQHKFRPHNFEDSNIEQPVPNPLTEVQPEAPPQNNELEDPPTQKSLSTEHLCKPGPSGLQCQRPCSSQIQLDQLTEPATNKQKRFVTPSDIRTVPRQKECSV